MDDFPKLTTENIDAILCFLPIFEAPGFKFGRCDSNNSLLSYYTLGEDAGRFYHALYEHNWIIKFPWMNWDEGRRLYHARPTQLDGVDLETLRKLLTAHVRQDRFCEGHLGDVFESGHLLAILRRLRDLRAVSAKGPSDEASPIRGKEGR